MTKLELDRTAKTPLAEQIRNGIRNAIETGVLASGARLPPNWASPAARCARRTRSYPTPSSSLRRARPEPMSRLGLQ